MTYEALTALVTGERPEASPVGIALAAPSLVLMLGRVKQRIGRGMGSIATEAEATQYIVCARLAGALLVGLAGNALFGLWWLDPAAGLVLAADALTEAVESWRGEGCCAPPPDGEADPPPACRDDCCTT